MTGLDVIKIEPWLSPQIGIGLRLHPSSPIRVWIQTTWRLQSESAMYSASVEDKATVFCAFVVYDIRPPASLMKKPEVDRCVFTLEAQSESVHTLSP